MLKISSSDKPFKLCFNINISNTAEKEQIDTIVSEFKDTLDKIDSCSLPNSAKIQAINVMCMSKLKFYYPNLHFTEKKLKEIEDIIVGYARHWLELNSSSTRSFFFTPKSLGGLGLINQHIISGISL